MDSRLVYPLADRYVRLEYYQSEVEAKRLADPKGTQSRLSLRSIDGQKLSWIEQTVYSATSRARVHMYTYTVIKCVMGELMKREAT